MFACAPQPMRLCAPHVLCMRVPRPPLPSPTIRHAGYVIVCALVRLMSEMGMSVERAVRRFAECRPPGIYKEGRCGREDVGG